MNQPEPLLAAPLQRADPALGEQVLRKVGWRLLPFLILLFIFNIIDRTNVGFAGLTMERDLELSGLVFTFGYGAFYVGYLLFEVPANLLLHRVGARRWIARIMISWGLVSGATMLVTGPVSFFAVRILLGVAEAGFFPGIILYLTYWFPARDRARVVALFMTALPVAGILSLPLSGAVMQYLDGILGLVGWQWLFLLEGVPSVVLGVVVLFYLTDAPAQARWLTPAERSWLVEHLRHEETERIQRHGSGLARALVDVRVWLLIGVYFTVAVGANASAARFPKLIGQSFSDEEFFVIGLLSALPNVAALVGMNLLGMHSDRTGERRGHVSLAAFVAAAGWVLAALASEPWVKLAGLCVAQMGMMSFLPCFWALPTSFLSGIAAAGGIALINSMGNLGGLLGPPILETFGIGAIAGTLVAGGVLVLFVPKDAGHHRACSRPIADPPGQS
jgi:ACS family tartrate transporter-like MFS transporter